MSVIVEGKDALRRISAGPALEKRWLEITGKKESLQSIVPDWYLIEKCKTMEGRVS